MADGRGHRTQVITVVHDFPDDDQRQVTGEGATQRTVIITLTLENAPPKVEAGIDDQDLELGRADCRWFGRTLGPTLAR